MKPSAYPFDPELYEPEIRAIVERISSESADGRHLSQEELSRAIRSQPKDGRGFFSKSDVVRGLRYLNLKHPGQWDERHLLAQIRMKPVRTASGVAPVTVLTKPFPCPGRCIFCPSDVRMPKSYLSDEPGARRAAQHRFDPYRQTRARLQALHNIGHPVDKVEMIILGGTWSSYPPSYQRWFIKRCFDAMNDIGAVIQGESIPMAPLSTIHFESAPQSVDGRETTGRDYNQAIHHFLGEREAEASSAEQASWAEVTAVQLENETAHARAVGLVIETRPDHLDLAEVLRLRLLGATKIQIGIQSLNDQVLALNKRGHDVAQTRKAFRLLRSAGFKIHAHWMPNLYGSSPTLDKQDYLRVFEDPALCPDELKIYPCSLIESAELMQHYDSGAWAPYESEELLDVLCHCMAHTPRYCRLTRVIRDIPGTDIVVGNKETNFRERAERELLHRGQQSLEIRAREIRHQKVPKGSLRISEHSYSVDQGEEFFLEVSDPSQRLLAGFLRLSLPETPALIGELEGAAIIREVHVYGRVAALQRDSDANAQHAGWGKRLVAWARELAAQRGYRRLAVISSVGTREYYRHLGFADGELYQAMDLTPTYPKPEGEELPLPASTSPQPQRTET